MTLTESQREAVEIDHPQVLVVAAPGSGKTLTVTERIKRLIRDGVPPSEIVAITYTREAAREINERLDGVEIGYSGTLHGFMLKLLSEHTKSPPVLIDEQTRDEIIRDVMDRMRCKATLRDVIASFNDWHSCETHDSRAKLIALAYWQRLQRYNLTCYDGLLRWGRSFLGKEETSQYNYLLVDEIQDASRNDGEIYDHLPIPNRFYVGDPSQCIFSFRGADLNYVLDFAKRSGTQIVALAESFRCCRAVTSAANNLIRRNRSSLSYEMTPAAGDGKVYVTERTNDEDELIRVAAGVAWHGQDDRVAVLLRTNRLVDQFAEALRAEGVSVSLPQPVELPHDWDFAILAMSVLANTGNDALVYQWLRHKFGPNYADHCKLVALRTAKPLWDVTLRDVPKPRHSLSPESFAMIESLNDGKVAASTRLVADMIALRDRREVTEGRCYVGTYHSAKGQEWDHVFLPALEDELIPGPEAIEDARRLLYVGITRATSVVDISFARCRKNPWTGATEKRTPCRFIQELGVSRPEKL